MGRSRFAGEPFSDDDATIAAMLEDVSIPTLMMSMMHMSGDYGLLDGDLRPQGSFINEIQGFMSPEDQAEVREAALQVIREYRDGGCAPVPPPDHGTVHRMMEFLVAEEIPADYVPLMLEELELDGVDARAPRRLEAIDTAARQDFPVVVIGGGMSGILAGIRLGQAGVPFTVIESDAGPGGTWRKNIYPGCRVDVGNHFYCYSFEPNEWSEFFAQHDELREYFENCADKYGVHENTRYSCSVTAATWDESTARWCVEVRNESGDVETLEAAALVSATGQLNIPKLPDIEGRDSFAGESMHTAQWVEGTELAGKRVAVIGTGASAFQLVPAIAPDTAHVDVFQRSAPWMFPSPHYHDEVPPGAQWALRHLPFYGRWYRFLIFWPACDGGFAAMEVDPDWPYPERAVSAANDAVREIFAAQMVAHVGDDSDLAEKVVPDYVCIGKRTLQDNGSWLSALTRDDVELITEPISRITPRGVMDDTGTEHEADLIVYATGFDANRYLWPMEITGRGGAVLAEQWGDEPRAYMGITVPNFPNLFIMYGPGTNLASAGSMIFHAECQMHYITECLAELIGGDNDAMECRQEVHDFYNDALQAELATMVWSHDSIRSSWYQNDSGEIYILSPWRLHKYWSMTKRVRLDDYTLSTVEPASR